MDNIKLNQGYTKISNKILEKLSKTKMGGSSWMVLMAIFRKTYGFNKKQDWISYNQLEKMTGLRKSNISRSIKVLSKMGIVIKSDNGNRTFLEISKNFKVLPNRITVIKSDNEVLSNLQPSVIKSGQKYGYTKETITKETIQKKYTSIKNLKEKDLKEIAEDYNVPIGFVKSKYDDLQNYCEAKGKTYKNYKSALRNFVKKDAIQIVKEKNDKSKISVARI